MKQLTQLLKNGKMEIIDVPTPVAEEGKILVKNYFSVISAGTESKTVSDARLGYLAKARSRKKEFMAVIDLAKTQGLWNTYKIVMNKLEAPSTLGYSSAGKVVAIGKNVVGFEVGDYVACAGLEASHSEYVAIPSMLAVKVKRNDLLHEHAFVALGAIALHGVRRADVQIGEHVLVIGLGTIGLITIQLLQSIGCKAYGIDIDDWAVEKAMQNGAYLALNRNHPGIENLFIEQTQGHGFDAVIITAGTHSLDPINFAGKICRKKGKVVIVGAVPTGYDREQYYRKEIDVLMSTSYGPGRYDKHYEEKGIDYPIGYVRWTEKRNMQAFTELIDSRTLNMSKIITHTFLLENAKEAYEMILNKTDKFAGIVIKYQEHTQIAHTITLSSSTTTKETSVNVGFIGAGSFAQNTLLPYVKKTANLIGVATNHGNTAYYVGKKFGFKFATTDINEILNNHEINCIFIATRHNSHAELVIKSLQANKHVFVEKPLCLTIDELNNIKKVYQNYTDKILMVGFNRRFSPFVRKIVEQLSPLQKKAILIRVNAGYIPTDHWIQDPNIGGGRIIGETCHFIDTAMVLAQSFIQRVYATAIPSAQNIMDTVNITLEFINGSVANIQYLANGNKRIPKEYIEVYADGNSYIINDFKKLTIATNSLKNIKLSGQDKGHKQEIETFIHGIINGNHPLPFDYIENVMMATFAVIDSIKTKTPMLIK
ncbi:MAG: bi-domain-containing oxidoreductase [Bacteroidales bacterium]|nr:bi-domain-containing oxidoreductase [Bacteroidales bacterium]